MKTLVLGCATTLALTTAAMAQTADISTITCADLAMMEPDGITTLLFWIDGYMGGQADDPTFDLERLGANIDGAVTLCTESPELTVMEVLQTAENG